MQLEVDLVKSVTGNTKASSVDDVEVVEYSLNRGAIKVKDGGCQVSGYNS